MVHLFFIAISTSSALPFQNSEADPAVKDSISNCYQGPSDPIKVPPPSACNTIIVPHAKSHPGKVINISRYASLNARIRTVRPTEIADPTRTDVNLGVKTSTPIQRQS
jgi:hypothetical protein